MILEIFADDSAPRVRARSREQGAGSMYQGTGKGVCFYFCLGWMVKNVTRGQASVR